MPINPILLFELGIILGACALAAFNWKAFRGLLGRCWRYVLNEDGEHLKSYLFMSFALVVLVVVLLN